MENYNKPDTKLEDLIFIKEGAIPSYVCDRVIKDIKEKEWKPHQWYDGLTNDQYSEETMELDVQHSTPDLQKLLYPAVKKTLDEYTHNYNFNTKEKDNHKMDGVIRVMSSIRFNRYVPGQIMRQHYDHIHALFDGEHKGIPILSFILNFNDDYEGAHLYFWDNEVIELGKGDIVIFPSLFFFPHGVTESTKGVRYSGVCWAW